MSELIDQAPTWTFVISLLLLSAMAYLVLRQVFSSLKYARYIEDTPTSKIRSASQGYLELEGTAHAIKLFREHAPLTLTPCCWYYYRIEELITRKRGQQIEKFWQVVKEDSSAHFFLLRDGTGTCVISPIGAQITTKNRKQWQGYNLPAHLTKSKKSLFDIFGKKRYYRFSESIIAEGDTLYVLGNFESLRTQKKVFSEEGQSEQLNLHTNHNKQRPPGFTAPVLIKPDDFNLAQKEWEALQKIRNEATELKTLHLMRDSRRSKQPFLISNYSQKSLSRKYKFAAFGYTLFFFALAAAPFWLVIERYVW